MGLFDEDKLRANSEQLMGMSKEHNQRPYGPNDKTKAIDSAQAG